jgi:hypothetical protein
MFSIFLMHKGMMPHALTLFTLIEKLMKSVSTSTWYRGPAKSMEMQHHP